MLDGPVVELAEMWVQLDVLQEDGYAFRKGEFYAVDHGAERVTEGGLVVQGVDVALAAFSNAETIAVS